MTKAKKIKTPNTITMLVRQMESGPGVSMNKIHLSEYKCPSDTARNRTVPQYTIGSAIPNKSTGTDRTPELPNHDCQILEWPENRNNDYRSHQGNQAHRNADFSIIIEGESARSQYCLLYTSDAADEL